MRFPRPAPRGTATTLRAQAQAAPQSQRRHASAATAVAGTQLQQQPADLQRMDPAAAPRRQDAPSPCAQPPADEAPAWELAAWEPAASRPEPVRGGALSLASPQGKEVEVPSTLPHALAVFFSHPSSILIVCALGGLLAWRTHYPPPGPADALVVGCVVAGWCLQEWLVHALLLHSSFDWVGRRVHVGHHQRGYFHVSIDDPPIVLAFMAASLAAFWLGFGGGGLAVTAAAAYYGMGLLYEYTHYIVHTRYLPTSRLGKRIRMHHLLHHTRHEGYWLAFTAPPVDALFGTRPDPSAVRMSDLARAGLAAARRGAP